MLKAERWNIIQKCIEEKGYASSTDLVAVTNTSKATIRRDLISMSEAGLVSLTHGGAISTMHKLPLEESYEAKNVSNADEKNRIAELTAGLIEPGSRIIIDSGTTTLKIIPFLRKIPNLTVITNDVNIACCLYNSSNIEVVMIGGSIRPGYCTVIGTYAERQVEGLNADLCIIGADAINEKGIYIANINEVGIKSSIIKASNSAIVVADHSKIGRKSLASICNLSSIDTIVTGKEAEKLPAVKNLASKCNLLFA